MNKWKRKYKKLWREYYNLLGRYSYLRGEGDVRKLSTMDVLKPHEIVNIIKSIKDIKVDGDDTVIIFTDEDEFVALEFKRGSFIRELFELIGRHIG